MSVTTPILRSGFWTALADGEADAAPLADADGAVLGGAEAVVGDGDDEPVHALTMASPANRLRPMERVRMLSPPTSPASRPHRASCPWIVTSRDGLAARRGRAIAAHPTGVRHAAASDFGWTAGLFMRPRRGATRRIVKVAARHT